MTRRLTRKAILAQSCPTCHINDGKRCLDLRISEGKTRYITTFHTSRVKNAQWSLKCRTPLTPDDTIKGIIREMRMYASPAPGGVTVQYIDSWVRRLERLVK